jgi:hypothetical protein
MPATRPRAFNHERMNLFHYITKVHERNVEGVMSGKAVHKLPRPESRY